jgi:hypothetical protein
MKTLPLELLFLPALLLPGCFLDRSLTPLAPEYVWTCTATIRVAGGAEVVLTSEDPVFAADMPVFATSDGDIGETPEDRMREQWRRYLRARLEGTALDPTLRELVGTSGWCLLSDAVTRTATEAPDSSVVPEQADTPLLSCVGTGPGCSNLPGEVPVIGFDPPGLDFGSVPVGRGAGPVPVTVSNSGSGHLCLDSPRIPGEDPARPEYTVDSSGCAPVTEDELRLGQAILSAARPTCTLNVAFTPRQGGLRSRTLQVTTDPPSTGGADTVPLRGVGEPGVLSAPASVCFNVEPFVGPEGRPCYSNTFPVTTVGLAVVTVMPPAIASDGTGVNWTVESPVESVEVTAGTPLTVRVRACDPAVDSSLVITSNAAPPTNSLLVRLESPTSGCTP